MINVLSNVKVECDRCGYLIVLKPEDFEYEFWNYNHGENGIDEGIEYSYKSSCNCTQCMNNIAIKISALEYPIGCINNQTESIDGAIFLSGPEMGIVHNDNEHFKNKAILLSFDIKKHPVEGILSEAIGAKDCTTTAEVSHRALSEINEDKLQEYMFPAIRKHHLSEGMLRRRKALLRKLKVSDQAKIRSQYPKNETTRKGNFGEIFLAEYLQEVTNTSLPVYRLRYNPNPDQSMKGDDVLCFDLDSDPVRIIFGEAKYRGKASKAVIQDILEGLQKSKEAQVPISLQFVADRLFEQGNYELGEKIENCAILIAEGNIVLDYVGILISKEKAEDYVNKYAVGDPHHLLMLSLTMFDPSNTINMLYEKLEEEYEYPESIY